MESLYTAEALSTGAGRNGHVRTTDGIVDLDLASPKAMGGSGRAPTLADAAHQVCPYSNATRGNIDVTVSVVDD